MAGKQVVDVVSKMQQLAKPKYINGRWRRPVISGPEEVGSYAPLTGHERHLLAGQAVARQRRRQTIQVDPQREGERGAVSLVLASNSSCSEIYS